MKSASQISAPTLGLWLVGVAVVAYTFFWHGCYHFTCSGGKVPEGVSYRSKRNNYATKFLGSFVMAGECEKACMDKKGCNTFTYFVEGDMAAQCFGNTEPAGKLVKDARAVSGRPYFLTESSLKIAAHPFAAKVQESFQDLVDSMSKWPIIAKAQKVFPTMPKFSTSNWQWMAISTFVVTWPAFFILAASMLSSEDEEASAKKTVSSAPAEEEKADDPIAVVGKLGDAITDVVGKLGDALDEQKRQSMKQDEEETDAKKPNPMKSPLRSLGESFRHLGSVGIIPPLGQENDTN